MNSELLLKHLNTQWSTELAHTQTDTHTGKILARVVPLHYAHPHSHIPQPPTENVRDESSAKQNRTEKELFTQETKSEPPGKTERKTQINDENCELVAFVHVVKLFG